jgi:hypothetical protein
VLSRLWMNYSCSNRTLSCLRMSQYPLPAFQRVSRTILLSLIRRVSRAYEQTHERQEMYYVNSSILRLMRIAVRGWAPRSMSHQSRHKAIPAMSLLISMLWDSSSMKSARASCLSGATHPLPSSNNTSICHLPHLRSSTRAFPPRSRR